MANGLSRKDFSDGQRLAQNLGTNIGITRVREAVQANPEWFCRGWASAESLKGKSRDECLGALREIFLDPSFDGVAVIYIVRTLAGAPLFGGGWPGTFITAGDARLARVVSRAACQLRYPEAAHAVVFSLMSLPPAAWSPIIRKAIGGNVECLGIVTNFANVLLADGRVPMPRSHARGLVIVDQRGVLTAGHLSKGKLDWDPGFDPRSELTIEPFDWQLETQQLVHDAGEIVNATIRADLVPDEIHSLCVDFASREAEIREQIRVFWNELRAASRGGDKSIKRWVTADGLTQMSFTLLGHKAMRTGINPATFFVNGQPFPHLCVVLEYTLLSRVISEKSELGHGGILSSIDEFGEGSVQRGLRLLQNLMIVRELHSIAFAEGYCGERNGKGHNGNGNANGDKPVQARLAHFRRIGHLCRQDGAPYEPSEAALARVPVSVVVPPGHTYVASPPIHSRAEHPYIKPLVIETTTEGLV